MEDIILVGYGGHAKSVADCIERVGKYKIAGYTDLAVHESKYPYLGTDDVLKGYFEKGIRNAAVGLGYMGKDNLRERLYLKLKYIGYSLPIIRDPSSVISETAQIGEGVFVGKGAIVNAEARIGKMAIINSMALVEHECIVGDFTHIAVSAVLCGQVEVGSAVLVGASAAVMQCLHVPSNVVVPAGETLRGNYSMEIRKGCKIISNNIFRVRGGKTLVIVRRIPKIYMDGGAA